MSSLQSIRCTTVILAPRIKVFDLSRSIDLHMESMLKSKEKAIEGKTTGLINQGETVKWKGKHFGLYLTHKSLIAEMIPPSFFVDEMVEGLFKSFRHEHHFKQDGSKTTMIDIIEYQTPFGLLGKLFDILILKKQLTQLVHDRNLIIKQKSEENDL